MADWFKLSATYPDDVSIVSVDDAAEVMFVRGLAYVRRAGSGGFIPAAVLKTLTRADGAARINRIAGQLISTAPDGSPGPWEAVAGGYRVRSWSQHNDAADKLDERLKTDAARQRRHRAAKKPGSHVAPSRDMSRDVTVTEERREEETAAAAAETVTTAAAAADLDGRVQVLRDKLRAHTPLRGLRFDTLRADQVAQLVALLEQHGDEPLVRVAIDTCRHPAPTHAGAFLGTWAALPPPGQPLHVVRQQLCPTHGTRLSPSGTCSSCHADQKAAR